MEYFCIFLAVCVLIAFLFYIQWIWKDYYVYRKETRDSSISLDDEMRVTHTIENALRSDDVLLTSLSLTVDGKTADLDDLIITKNGVFIIIPYVGSYSRFTNKKMRQAVHRGKRQLYVLHKYLGLCGISIWLKFCIFVLDCDCTKKSRRYLFQPSDVDRIIHSKGMQTLDRSTINTIYTHLFQSIRMSHEEDRA
ncbi:MAG: hypothetical protein K6G13_07265 [Agathobacter sp.]|uniref:hypothetical protein n=1 Tax=Agathobacter sp. TaxID=2021311 RepID=UPI00258B445C|nr:hypothetical protein [Agathobacter sp.]MCR5677808.1 hypothetical protein [Agathobacter sp.]